MTRRSLNRPRPVRRERVCDSRGQFGTHRAGDAGLDARISARAASLDFSELELRLGSSAEVGRIAGRRGDARRDAHELIRSRRPRGPSRSPFSSTGSSDDVRDGQLALDHVDDCHSPRPASDPEGRALRVQPPQRAPISTRYAILAAEPVKTCCAGLIATGVHIREAAWVTFDGLHAVEHRLVRHCIWDDHFYLAVHHQDERAARLRSRSSSATVLRLKSLRDRMSLARSSMGRLI